MTSTPASPSPSRGSEWRNWSGLVRFKPAAFGQPRSLDELRTLIRDAARSGQKVRVAGSGHSFVPLVETDGLLLNLDHLSGIETIGKSFAALWAGTHLKPLGLELSACGFGMLNLGDINKQAIAGAVATGTHGTGLRLGSISSQVKALTMVLASGETVSCSAEENPALFAAARVSLGALGVIAKLTVELQPRYKLKLIKKTMPLDECLTQAPQLAAEHRHFEFYWFPHTRLAGVKLMDPTQEPESNRGLTTAAELVLENGAFGLASRIARVNPAWAASISKLIAWTMKGDAGTMVADCHRAFSSPRLVRFHEMEYELPASRGPDALRELAEFVDYKKIQVHFPVEYRYVRGDGIWLSPFYERDSVAISVHQYVGMDYDPYFRGAEAIFRNHGGRPHWGKMHYLSAKELAPLYPRWNDFQQLRRELDPRGMFMNAYLERLLGI
jgi:L-gulonolactone oxidase